MGVSYGHANKGMRYRIKVLGVNKIVPAFTMICARWNFVRKGKRNNYSGKQFRMNENMERPFVWLIVSIFFFFQTGYLYIAPGVLKFFM